MATQAMTQPQALRTAMNYHLEPERGGATDWCPGTVQDKRPPHEHKEVTATNIRGRQADFTLDKHGFEVGPFATCVNEVDDNTDLTGQYYQDVAAHMKKVAGATKVIPVVHIARRKPWEQVAEADKDLPDTVPVTGPTYNRSVHIDQSYFGAKLVLDNKLANNPDASQLKSSRSAIINLWRPPNHVTRDSLAVYDARTADEEDMVALYAI